ncbi:MAG TPA: hypothetical protein VLE91_00310 [Candidatus Saccharimonadales bacterium]|nr:hypothetical protein [Candidatus Saccharimonadales bacterium]
MSKLPKIASVVSSTLAYLALATNAFAQSATSSAPKGGTSGSLPSAGSTEITYLLFVGGIVLFVFGTLKLVTSFKES